MKTQSPDTHPEAEKKLIALLRKQSAAQKWDQIRSLTEMSFRLSKRAIARRNKHLNEEQINLLFIEYHYGKELADRVREYLKKRTGRSVATIPERGKK